MKHTFIIISSILTIISALPYLKNVIEKKTKPRIVSWFTWTLITAMAAAASFSEHNYASAFLALSACSQTVLIVVFGYKYGDRKFERIDIFSQLAAIVGLGWWLLFNTPLVALVAAITVDLIGAIPTIKHSYKKPNEETASVFFISGLGAIFALLGVEKYNLHSLVFPIYILLANVLLVSIISLRRNKLYDSPC